MRKKIMTLMMGMLLLLTACGQTGSNSASKMLPVAAVQSAAQAIAPVEDKAQEDTESLPAEETVEETQDADSEETPKPAEDAETPSTKTEETPSAPAETPPPTAPEELATPALVPEDKPAPHPHRHLHRNRQRRNRRKILCPNLSLHRSRNPNRQTAGRLLAPPMLTR